MFVASSYITLFASAQIAKKAVATVAPGTCLLLQQGHRVWLDIRFSKRQSRSCPTRLVPETFS